MHGMTSENRENKNKKKEETKENKLQVDPSSTTGKNAHGRLGGHY